MDKPIRYSPSEPREFFSRYRFPIIIGAVTVSLAALLSGLYVYHRIQNGRKIAASAVVPAPPPEVTVALPKAFGGTVRAKTLLKLLDAAHHYENLNPSALRLSLEGIGKSRPPNFPVGEKFRVRIGSPQECFYALVHRSADGSFATVAPSMSGGSEADQKLTKGVIETLTVHATAPGGQQEFMLISTGTPVNLEQLLSGSTEAYPKSLSVAVFPYVAPEK